MLAVVAEGVVRSPEQGLAEQAAAEMERLPAMDQTAPRIRAAVAVESVKPAPVVTAATVDQAS
jgi:hypothetical protein